MTGRRTGPLAWLLIQPIRFYQRFITPYTPATCRYYPTCSSYAVRALRTHGALKGTALTTWRLLRCNPWSSGGIDHVPPRGRWRALQPTGAADGVDAAPGDALDPTPVIDPAEGSTERDTATGRCADDPPMNARPHGTRAPIAGSTAA